LIDAKLSISGLTADYVVVAGQERSVDVWWIKNYGGNQCEKEKSNQGASIEFMLGKQWWPQIWGCSLKSIVEFFRKRPREILKSSPLGSSSFPLLSAARTVPSRAGQFQK
jgi:hypothetical protein